MNRTRLLLIGFFALALGAIVSYAVYRTLQTRTGADAAPGVEVVVAANDIPVGSKVADGDVKLVRFPVAVLPSNIFHLKTSVVGRGAILPIARGRKPRGSRAAKIRSELSMTSENAPSTRRSASAIASGRVCSFDSAIR